VKTTTLAIVFLAAFAAVAAAGPCTNGETVTAGLTCTLTDTFGDVLTFSFYEVDIAGTGTVSFEIPAVPAPPGGFVGVDLGFEIASSETEVTLEYTVRDSATDMIAIINGLPNSTPVTNDFITEWPCYGTFASGDCSQLVGSGTFNGPVALPLPVPTNVIFVYEELFNTGTPPVSSFTNGFEVAPEPSAMFLMAAGLSCLGSLSWKLRRR